MLKNFKPRLYQETILATAAQSNTLVVLPTGMGKTAIAAMLAAHRLENYPDSKMLFLAPTRPLAQQHYHTFQELFERSKEDFVLFTGYTKPEMRQELWKSKTLIFSTPQGLENDLLSSKISLSEVSIIVFDEAHRAIGDYSYVFIARKYQDQARHPRIIGLTASPGSDLEHIKEVMKNLYIERVEVRTDEDPDVRPYVQETDVEFIKVELPEEFKSVRMNLQHCFLSKLEQVKKLGLLYGSVSSYSKTALISLQSALHAKLASGERDYSIMKSLSYIAEAMKVQHALELIETQGVAALQAYLQDLEEKATKTKVKAVQNLVRDLNYRSALIKTGKLVESGAEHPKLAKLTELVCENIKQDPGIKIIIFNQYRDQAKTIKKRLDELGISNKIFVGQAKKRGLGISQKEQKQMLEEFSNNEFNCLISTSVGEEGLDIPSVDLVIFYEPVPSAIRTIQRKGRTGRHEKGRVIVLVTKNTRDEGYSWSAHHKENRMYRNLQKLKNDFLSLERPEKREDTRLKEFIGKNLRIVADFREKGSPVMKELANAGISLDVRRLEVADYLLSEDVAVEFKTVRDFVDSIIDGRLLGQLKDLRKYPKSFILLEGQEDIYSQRKVNANAIRGMMSAIMLNYRIPIIRTSNPKDSAAYLSLIALHEQDPEKKEFQYHHAKPLTLKEQQEYVVSSLPGIGTALARPLLKKFRKVRSIFTASEENLQKVDLIGEKKAKAIREVLDNEYEE